MVSVKKHIAGVRSHRDRNDDSIGNMAMGALVLASLALPFICYSGLNGRINAIDARMAAEHRQASDRHFNPTNVIYSANSATNYFVGQ